MEFTRDLWPLHKLKQNISCSSEGDGEANDVAGSNSRRPRAVLLTTGAFNPIHCGHLNNFHRARTALESKGYNVVAGFLSPSHDLYVKAKMVRLKEKDQPLEHVFAPSVHRIKLVEEACRDSTWISAAAWEACQPIFVDFPEVTEALDSFLRSEGIFTSENDLVHYVYGDDHFENCGLYSGIHSSGGVRFPVVVFARQSYTPSNYDAAYVEMVEEEDILHGKISSTIIRKEMNSGGNYLHMLPDGIREIMRKGFGCSLYGQNQGSLVGAEEDSDNIVDVSGPKTVFISFSLLSRQLNPSIYVPPGCNAQSNLVKRDFVPQSVLDSSLFFFGGKEFWFFPTSPEEELESEENGDYMHYARNTPFGDLLRRKIAADEVFFLKPNILGPVDCNGGVFGDYQLASEWLQRLGYPPLLLDPAYWRSATLEENDARCHDVIWNFTKGYHDYSCVLTLLRHSIGHAGLEPVLLWSE